MDKEFEIEIIDRGVTITFNSGRMPEYFVQWFDNVGRESFEASLIDINE